MNQKPNRRSTWLLLGIFLLISFLLTWLFRPVLREFIVPPLLAAYAQIQAQVHSIEPGILWGGFILIIYTLTLATFPPISSVLSPTTQPHSEASTGRLGYWFLLMHWHYRESHLMRYTLLDLKKLAREVVAFRLQCSSEAAESWIRANSQSLPDEINWLFQPQQPLHIETIPEPRQTFWQNLVNLILGPASPYAEHPSQTSALSSAEQARIAAIIQYFELQTELFAGGLPPADFHPPAQGTTP